MGHGARRQSFDRVAANLVNLLVVLLLIAGSVLVARQIDWKELAAMFKDPGAGVRTEDPKRAPAVTRPVDRRRRTASETKGAGMTGSEVSQTASIESVRGLPQKIEELPEVAQRPVSAQVQVEPRPAEPPIEPAAQHDAVIGVEQSDTSSTARLGYLTIQSYTQARIYVDGQFSGTTPRTVRLASGEHQIRLIADGYEEWTRDVRLKSRQKVGIMASMKKRP